MTSEEINPAELEERINRLSQLDFGIKELTKASGKESDSVTRNHSMYTYILSTIPKSFAVEDLINYHEYLLTGIIDRIAVEILIGESRLKFSGNPVKVKSDFEKSTNAKELYKKLNKLRNINVWLSKNKKLNIDNPQVQGFMKDYNNLFYSLNTVSLDELLDYRAYALNSLYNKTT